MQNGQDPHDQRITESNWLVYLQGIGNEFLANLIALLFT